MRRRLWIGSLLLLGAALAACEPPGYQIFASPQSRPLALSPDGTRLYVANTTSNTVSVIDTASQTEILEIPVGLEPVAVAAKPDGSEVWVANHVSDSVSVIDTDPLSPTFHTVVRTVQDLGPVSAGAVTAFDEPVGIAFASNAKAYVALSSRNRIAVIDATTYSVTGALTIPAQDPRAIRVRDGRLYVVAFESGNQSELSACVFAGPPGDTQCTFGFNQLGQVATNPNLPGVPKNIVRDPDVPDRDLFVFDTATDQPVGSPVDGVGTLLYGIAVSSSGDVFIANTDARNHDQDGNGLAAPISSGRGLGLGLADLENRAFHNQITRVACGGASCGVPTIWHLEPDPPTQPAPGTQLATPYGIEVTSDDRFLVISAAASNRIASVDASTGAVISRLDVGEIPRGIELWDNGDGTHTVYVLNTLGNSVTVATLSAAGLLSTLTTIADVGSDPTPDDVRLGRIAFNSASGSSTGTFACASCHPDAHVDQLLWVIGATCDLVGGGTCDQEEPRLTMPIRGLRETLPLHWDGTLGDPFGGPNGEVGPAGNVPPNCSLSDPLDCFRQLVDASLGGVMCSQPNCPPGPSGLPGAFTAQERDQLALFLSRVSYPPARSRRIDDRLTASAVAGMADFFLDQNGGGGGGAQTCGDTTGGCHALPLGTSTNSPVVGAFDAPTWRGMTDRFIHFSSGFTAPQEIMDALVGTGWHATGYDELTTFQVPFPTVFTPVYGVGPNDIFQMFEEASTGFSGALGRQVTVSQETSGDPDTDALLAALEAADDRKVVNLQGDGLRNGVRVTLSYEQGGYRDLEDPQSFILSRADILAEAATGSLVMTFTAKLNLYAGEEQGHPQPLIDVPAPGGGATGDPDLPVLPADNPFQLRAVAVRRDAIPLLDGQRVPATVSCVGGTFSPFCTSGLVEIEILNPPTQSGLYMFQLLTNYGLLSNEFPICVGPVSACL